jgi:hypothetical protein
MLAKEFDRRPRVGGLAAILVDNEGVYVVPNLDTKCGIYRPSTAETPAAEIATQEKLSFILLSPARHTLS